MKKSHKNINTMKRGRQLTPEEEVVMEAAVSRRESLVRRACQIMGWEYHTSLVWAGIRKVAIAEAVPVSLDKLEAILDRLEGK